VQECELVRVRTYDWMEGWLHFFYHLLPAFQ